MSMILLPNEPAVHPVIPQKVLKQLTDHFRDLPFARLIIHLTTNKTGDCTIILNNSLIDSPYKKQKIISGKPLPPLDKPIGANRNDIWIPRAPLIIPPRPWYAPVIPVAGAPPARPTPLELNNRPVPIAPTTSMYVYPLQNPPADATELRRHAVLEEKDVLNHWDFLEKQIVFKLNNIFFGNKEGVGEDWKKVLLNLPSPSQPSNTADNKLYKLLLKPTFKGKGVNNWRIDPNISAHPITSPKAVPVSYFDQLNALPAALPVPPAPLLIPDKGINTYSTVKPYKFFVYPIPRRFHYTNHQALPIRPYWPPLCDIIPQPGAPAVPVNAALLPPFPPPPIGPAVAPPLIIPTVPPNPHGGKASLLTAYGDMELHINIKLKLEVEEIKLEGRDIDSEIIKLKKIHIEETGEGIYSKTKRFCGDIMKKTKSLINEKYGPGNKNFKRAAISSRRNIDRDLERDLGTQAEGTTLNRATNQFNAGTWLCGGRRTRKKKNRKKSTRRKKNRKTRKSRKKRKKNRKKGTRRKRTK